MLQVVSIGIGGFAEAVAPYLLDGWVTDRPPADVPTDTREARGDKAGRGG